MIEVSNLTRYFGDFPVLRDVSFRIDKGEIVGLLGLNGAGKTTTLRVLAGLLPPSSGEVTVDGIDVSDTPDALRKRIGFLPETPPQYDDMTVTTFLRHIGRLKGMTTAAVNAKIPEVIALAQLNGREHQVIGTLSHGFRKRVGIAQTVIHNPSLVVLDEPISGLDPVQIVEMRKVVRSLGEGRAVILSSHILSEISQTCDRILVLHEGRLIAQGTEAELTRRLGDARIVLTVRGDQAKLEAWLNEHPLVEDMVSRQVPQPFASAIVDLAGDSREEFLPQLSAAGFGLRLVEVPDDELEEIFLGLTREGGLT
jgi:ABC-2 type transport system ATP-binding protein